MHLGPILIKRGEAGQLIVRVPYTRERVAKIKTIVGRRWHQGERHWTVPHTDDTLRHLLALFAGEPVEVEPSLRPANLNSKGDIEDASVGCHTVPGNHPLLEQVRVAARARHLSHNTAQAYGNWIKRFMSFHGSRHAADMGEPEIGRFLSSLATASQVSASTQNQALNALLFLYHEVLEKKIGLIQGVVRAKRGKRLPAVLTKDEVRRLLDCLSDVPWLMAMLLYGAGLRLMERCQLRVKGRDCCRNQIMICGGKGVHSPADRLIGTVDFCPVQQCYAIRNCI